MKPKISGDTVKRILGYIKKKYTKHFIIVVICIIFSTVASVMSSIFLKSLIDDYITPLIGIGNPDFNSLMGALLVMACIFLTGIVSTYLYNRIMAVISQGVLKSIRDEMFCKMQKLPVSYFDTHTHGDIMSHYTNDTDTLEQMISQSLPQMISCIISITAVFCAMLYMSPLLTIFVIAFTFLIFKASRAVAGNSAKYFINQQKSIGQVNGYVEEMINGAKVIKVFTHEDEIKKDFSKINNELCENMYSANKFANILMPLCGSLGNLEYVLVAIIGGILTLKFNMNLTVGALASFLSLTKSFNQPISQVSAQMNSIIMALAGATRIFEMMDSVPEENDGTVKLVNVEIDGDDMTETDKSTGHWAWRRKAEDNSYEYIELKGHVQLENVTFSYNGEKDVLHNISLYAKPGQKIALVGATGAGKTTITNLINRFYDLKDGRITYDGIDIREINKVDLRRSLGMVLQDTNLFTGTIKENIKYGKPDATDEQVIDAAKIANAHNFIDMLPNGYDTLIEGNGESLSQGQKQLLSIARAAINDPPVMILDEATSSIDTRTEKIVQDGMDKLMKGRTVFVIAHRLSTVRNANAIIVLDHGKIIERGDHDDLLKQRGQYYQLYTGAFELE